MWAVGLWGGRDREGPIPGVPEEWGRRSGYYSPGLLPPRPAHDPGVGLALAFGLSVGRTFRAFSGAAMRDFKAGAVAQRGTGCVGGLNTSKAARKLGDPSGVQSRPVQWGGSLADRLVSRQPCLL